MKIRASTIFQMLHNLHTLHMLHTLHILLIRLSRSCEVGLTHCPPYLNRFVLREGPCVYSLVAGASVHSYFEFAT